MTDIHKGAEPFLWIQLELLPLPHSQDSYSRIVVWWNPDERVIVGDDSEIVIKIIEEAKLKGASGPNESVELSDPLGKPTELAAILGKYFWVVPQPVREPGVYQSMEDSQEAESAVHSLQ